MSCMPFHSVLLHFATSSASWRVVAATTTNNDEVIITGNTSTIITSVESSQSIQSQPLHCAFPLSNLCSGPVLSSTCIVCPCMPIWVNLDPSVTFVILLVDQIFRHTHRVGRTGRAGAEGQVWLAVWAGMQSNFVWRINDQCFVFCFIMFCLNPFF